MGVPFIVSQYMVAVMAGRKFVCDKPCGQGEDKRDTLDDTSKKIFFAVYYLLLMHMFLNVNFMFRLL